MEKQQQYATVADEVTRWLGGRGIIEPVCDLIIHFLGSVPDTCNKLEFAFFAPWLCPKEKTKGASSVSACLPVVISSVFVSTCLPVVSRRLF